MVATTVRSLSLTYLEKSPPVELVLRGPASRVVVVVVSARGGGREARHPVRVAGGAQVLHVVVEAQGRARSVLLKK